MKNKIIVFDFDGVIINSLKLKEDAFASLYSDKSVEVEEKMRKFHQKHGGMPRAKKIKMFESQILGIKTTDAEIVEKCNKFENYIRLKIITCELIPGVKKFIQSTSKKNKLYINSAVPDTELQNIVNDLNMSQYFKKILGSSNNKVENLLEIIKEESALAEDILFFGDAISDYYAASIVGVNFCAVTYSCEDPVLKQLISKTSISNIDKFDERVKLSKLFDS